MSTTTASLESITTPFLHPLEKSGLPLARPTLTTAEEAQLEILINLFNSEGFTLPGTLAEFKKNDPSYITSFFKKSTSSSCVSGGQPLSEIEKCYLSREQLLRCLRAEKWDTEAATRRAEEILVWRRDFDVENITFETIREEALTGKEFVLGFDNHSRPILYMFPKKQNTEESIRQIQFVVYCIEMAIHIAPPTIPCTDTLALAIDLNATDATTGKSAPPASIGQSKKVLTILQTYNPERLGKAILIGIPTVFKLFYTLISPFIDPVTKSKISFGEDPLKFVNGAQLVKEFGGQVDFAFDVDVYYPSLEKTVLERKAERMKRWRDNGSKCGISEEILSGARGGDVSIAAK